MNYNYDEFEVDINKGLELSKRELNNRKDGIEGESTIEQLEKIVIPELSELLEKIKRREALPPNNQKDRFLRSFGYAFRDWGWDMRTPTALYLQLLKIHEGYRKV